MGDVLMIAILVASFALVIALIQVISRMLANETDLDEPTWEPPGPSTPEHGDPGNGVTGPLGWRQ